MNALKCSQCGGDINPVTGKCDYCKTKFQGLTLEHAPRMRDGLVPLISRITVPFNVRATLTNEQGQEMALEHAAMEFKELIKPYIEMRSYESVGDPLGDMVIEARLLVRKP